LRFSCWFVGLGVDFGIQFSVRYPADAMTSANAPCLISRASKAGAFVGRAATALGFSAFLRPLSGLSELGRCRPGHADRVLTASRCCRAAAV